MTAAADTPEWIHLAGAAGSLRDDAERGEARGLAESWDASAAADWRALLVRLATSAAEISLRPPTLTQGAITVRDPSRSGYASPEHARAASALCRTVAILADGRGRAAPTVTRGNLRAANLSSGNDAGDAERSTDPSQWPLAEGFLFLAAAPLALVAGPLGAAGFVGYSLGARFSAAAAFDDARALDKADDKAELVRLTIIAETMIRAHRDAEKRAGRALPWTPAERAVLAQVEALQKLIAGRMKRRELEPKPADPWAFLHTLASGAVTALEIFAAAAAVAGAAWLYSKTR